MKTKNKIEELEKRIQILEGMVKSLWRDSHPLEDLEVVL